MRNDTVSTLTFPAFAGATDRDVKAAKPSLLARLAAAMADSRRRKAQRVINEREIFFGPSLMEAAGLKHISLANDDVLPLK